MTTDPATNDTKHRPSSVDHGVSRPKQRGHRSIVWDALLSAVGWIALAGFGLITSTVIYRAVGDAGFGIWATVLALRAILLWFDGGLVMGVIRDAALLPTEAEAATTRIRTAQMTFRALGLVAVALGLLASTIPGALLGLREEEATDAQLVTVLLAFDAGIALAASPLTAVIRGFQRFDLLAYGSVAHALIGSVLLIAGASTAGLPGAALGLLLARTIVTTGYLAWVYRGHRELLGMTFESAGFRSLIRFSAPLWLISLGTLMGQSTDVPIVGAFFSATAAGHFALGAVPASVMAGALWMLIDTVYPRLVAAEGQALLSPLRLLVLAASFLGALGLTILALSAAPLLRLWIGEDPPLAQAVIVIYALTWLLNMPAHVLALAAIARNRHQALAPLVLAEAVVNLILSLILIIPFGAIGPAIGTAISLAASNLIFVPVLLLRRVDLSLGDFVRASCWGYGIGAAAAVATWMIANFASDSDWVSIGTSALVPIGIVIALGVLWIKDQHRIQVWAALLVDRGWFHLILEAREAGVARARIAEARRRGGRPEANPLVTVRIATYNRGQLVADRAIASAIAQTYENLEILVVGDACDAQTEAAVRSVQDPRIVFHNLPERGTYPADPAKRWMVAGAAPMNWALDHARGEWIAPLDDDDEFSPDHVEVLLRGANVQSADFVYGIAESEQEPGVWGPVGSWPPREGHIVHAAVMYNTRLAFLRHSVDAWRLLEPGDWNLWKRMRNAGARMAFVDRVVVRHFLEKRELRVQAPTPGDVVASNTGSFCP